MTSTPSTPSPQLLLPSSSAELEYEDHELVSEPLLCSLLCCSKETLDLHTTLLLKQLASASKLAVDIVHEAAVEQDESWLSHYDKLKAKVAVKVIKHLQQGLELGQSRGRPTVAHKRNRLIYECTSDYVYKAFQLPKPPLVSGTSTGFCKRFVVFVSWILAFSAIAVVSSYSTVYLLQLQMDMKDPATPARPPITNFTGIQNLRAKGKF